MPHVTSHMQGTRAAGGVNLYFDGHAIWIGWKSAAKAEGAGVGTNAQGTPFFWVSQN